MRNFVSLKLNKEFKRTYYQGKFKANPLVVTYVVKNKLGINRVGFTTSKKIGNAVKRNRARRILRVAYLNAISTFDLCGYDFVFLARDKTPASSAKKLEPIIKKHISLILLPNNQKKS
ncbi:MAG: ribonuclease P protein component [Oscillospiraceae bacterium]